VNDRSVSSSKKLSRIGLYILPGFIGLLVIAVSIWWVAATRMADAGFDRWLANEAGLGRQWSCTSRSIAGFPFRIELRCDGFSMMADKGEVRSGSLGGFLALAQIYDPKHVLVDVNGPLTARLANGQTVSLSWQTMRSSLHFETPVRADRVSWVVEELAMESPNPPVSGKLSHGEFHMRKIEGEPNGPSDVEMVMTASGGTLHDLPPAASFDAHFIVKKGWLMAENPGRAGLENWRTSGGEVLVDQWTMKRGEQALELKGSVTIYDGHRLNGKIDVSAAGLGDALKESGLSILGGSLGAGNVKLPLTLNKGRLLIGPLKIAEIPPLY
jgi:hypothetical protein